MSSLYKRPEGKVEDTSAMTERVMKAIAGLGLGVALYLAAFLVGITPASPLGREFIEDVRTSEFSTHPRVAASLLMADSGWYVSKQDVDRVGNAIRHIRPNH